MHCAMRVSSQVACRVGPVSASCNRPAVMRTVARPAHTATRSVQHYGLSANGRGLRTLPHGRRELGIVNGGRGFLRNMEELAPEADKLEYSLPLEVEMYPSKKLRAKNLRVGKFDEELETLATEMFKTMYRTDGVGLAAPQVGVNVQLMVYNPEGAPNMGKEYVLVNPKIVKRGKETDLFDEGCLSFPKICAEVERPLSCKVEYQDLKGRKKTMKLVGWQARIFQHEFDHLEGKLFHDRMTEEVLKNDGVQSQLDALIAEHKKKYGDGGAP